MRQVRIPQAGKLELREAADPLPGAGEVRLRAAGAHHFVQDREHPGKALPTP